MFAGRGLFRDPVLQRFTDAFARAARIYVSGGALGIVDGHRLWSRCAGGVALVVSRAAAATVRGRAGGIRSLPRRLPRGGWLVSVAGVGMAESVMPAPMAPAMVPEPFRNWRRFRSVIGIGPLPVQIHIVLTLCQVLQQNILLKHRVRP